MKTYAHFSLRKYNTFGIDAVAERFVRLDTLQDYSDLLRSGMLQQSDFFVLGGGSNVVLPDHYNGLIVHPANEGIRLIEDNGVSVLVEAQAGTSWTVFVDRCISEGWHGLENLAGIPGSVGAAPVQNVGAYGREAKDAIEWVHCYDVTDGTQQVLPASDCQFAYRYSIFKGPLKGRCLIDSVCFRLQHRFEPHLSYKGLASALSQKQLTNLTARQLADVVTDVRNAKLPNPNEIGSAGSFFKNPVVASEVYQRLKMQHPDLVAFENPNGSYKLAAGWLIEQAGWKGRSLGRAAVYDKQALVLVNSGGATSSDVRALADAVINDVEARFGVHLDCEAIFV